MQFDPTGTINAPFITPTSETPAQDANFSPGFERISLYGYHDWQIADSVLLVGGVSYDRITFPENFRIAPISDKKKTEERVSPKAGLIWTPANNTILRAVYTRSLSGASIDQSSQLEPSQVAGFLQSFRSIIPESIGGTEAGARFETYGVSLEQKFPTGTYLGLSAESLNSKVDRTVGVLDLDFADYADPAGTPEHRPPVSG